MQTASVTSGSAWRTRLRSSILIKWTFFVAVVVVLTAAALGSAGYFFARRVLREEIHERLEVVAASRKARLENFASQQRERLALVASRTRLRQLIRRRQQRQMDAESFRTESGKILQDARNSTAGFLAIWICDLDGNVITSTDANDLTKSFAEDTAFEQGRQAIYMGVPSQDGNYETAYLAGPALSDQGELLGVVMVLMDAHPLAALLRDATGLGRSGEVLVGTRRGDRIEYLVPGRHTQSVTVAVADVPVMNLAVSDGNQGFGQTNYAGTAALAAWRPVALQPDSNRSWGMVVKLDTSEAYAPVARLRRILLILLPLVLCAGIMFSYIVAHRFALPIRALAGSAEQVASGDLSSQVPVRSNDEIGQLAAAFNDMTKKLRASYATLEHRVQERTEELEEANRALARSNKDLDDFAYIASHDLKEPLRGISNYASFLNEDHADVLDDEGRERLATIRRLCKRLDELIDSLLRYSRVGRSDLAIQDTDLNELLDGVIDTLHVSLNEAKIDVRVPRPLPTIRCDSVRVQEVFRNLVANAMKYNDKPEKWIEIGFVDDGAGDAGLDPDGAEVPLVGPVFYVGDNGIGIAEKHLDAVFRIFRRLHARDAYGGGTGAGLTLVKKIVERHGGRIWVESTSGEGTTFFFTLQ